MAEAAAEEMPKEPAEGEAPAEAPADGEAPAEGEEEAEPEEDWDKPMDELELLEKFGYIDIEERKALVEPFFMSAGAYMQPELVAAAVQNDLQPNGAGGGLIEAKDKTEGVYFCKNQTKPYMIFSREAMFEDIKKHSFASPWDEKKKDIAKAGGEKKGDKNWQDEFLLIKEDKKAHEAIIATITEMRDAIIQEYEAAKAARRAAKEGGGVVGEDGVVMAVGEDGPPAAAAID